MPSLFVLIFALSMIACGDGDRRPENQSSNPLHPSGLEQVQRSQIVTIEGASVSEAEVVIIDAERLVVLARAPVDDQGGFAVSVPQRPSYWLGVSGPYMTTYLDTAFAFTGEAITVDEPPRSPAAGKAAQVVGILGDVNNDNQVDIADALLVLLYTLERFSFAAPNQGNIALGDVNEDGQIDIADVLLIMTYIANPLDPTLPDGIGLGSDRDRAVLIALYEATGGNNWDDNTNWLSSTYPLAQWYGVETDDAGRVTSLNLVYNSLTGEIPETLGNLNNLQNLDLAYNGLTGEIPETLGNLNNLQNLDLSSNELTGPIPEALGQLNNLQNLDLSSNELTGTIPESLAQLNNLEIFILADNRLTGPIPKALGQLDSLKSLDLAYNELTGTIPESLAQLNNLEIFILADNRLTGPIPKALGQLDSLKSLDLAYNELTGTIPEALGQLNNIQSLSLAGNELTGCIPSALNAARHNLIDLGLAFCHLESGEAAILAAFYEATGGDDWKKSTNWLSGAPLSEWYGVTTDDEGWVTALNLTVNVDPFSGDVDFSGNGLTGTIPETLGNLSNLESLSLASNGLTGTIPEALGQLNNLKSLDLASNGLTGTIPEALGQLNNLELLNLSQNELTETIPETLGQLNNLKDLYLRNNELTGTIPEALGQLNNLRSLDLAFNELTGTIPEALGQLDSLEFLYLSWNELTGCIPSALRDVPHNDLRTLGLSSCQ